MYHGTGRGNERKAIFRTAADRTAFLETRARGSAGTYGRLLGQLARVDVLFLDDLALVPLQEAERRDLLEILEDRYGTRSTIVTSQLEPNL